MEELIRRVRRIEKLTEKMSEGNIPIAVVDDAKLTIASIMKAKN